jgi:hypothetical protein
MNHQKLKRYTKTSLLNCKWEKEGVEILTPEKLSLNIQEKEKIKFLLTLSIPNNKIRKEVKKILLTEFFKNQNFY